MGASNLVMVQAFATHVEAEVAMSLLASSGIEAMIQADTAGGMREHLAWSGLGFRVLVREEDAAAARDLLRTPADSEFVLLHIFGVEDEADAALGALLAEGIPAIIQDDSARAWQPGAPWTGTGFRLLVAKDEEASAREVLQRTSGAKS